MGAGGAAGTPAASPAGAGPLRAAGCRRAGPPRAARRRVDLAAGGVGSVPGGAASPPCAVSLPEEGASARNRAARFVRSATPSPTCATLAPPRTRRSPNRASHPPIAPSRPSAELQFRPTAPIRAPRFWDRRPRKAASRAARASRRAFLPIHRRNRISQRPNRFIHSQMPTPNFQSRGRGFSTNRRMRSRPGGSPDSSISRTDSTGSATGRSAAGTSEGGDRRRSRMATMTANGCPARRRSSCHYPLRLRRTPAIVPASG